MSEINIYVGNLSFASAEDELRELFEQYGRVDSARIITDRFTGRSRGFGFVEMADRQEGMRAIEELDSRDFKGRTLRVNEARPRSEGRREGGREGGRDGGREGGGGRFDRRSRY